MSDPKPSIMAGPQLGICDVHPGVHTFRNDPSPCIGWMDYEPFQIPASDSRMLSPGDRPEAVSELEEDCEHGVFLSTGVKGIWRCTVCVTSALPSPRSANWTTKVTHSGS
jgi:hypothetical protein